MQRDSLIALAKKCRYDIIEDLLLSGDRKPNERSLDGLTLLHELATHAYPHPLRMAVHYGADIEARDWGFVTIPK